MKVTCKITGEDMTSQIIKKWEAEYLQKKISKEFKLDELLTKNNKKNGLDWIDIYNNNSNNNNKSNNLVV